MKRICSQEEHICNWWPSISIYTSVTSSNCFHWVTSTITVILTSNFKNNNKKNLYFTLLCFCLLLFLYDFSSTILHSSNATEVKHWSTWASWQDIFWKKTKCLERRLTCQNNCTCRSMLVVISFEWGRGTSLMGRFCFLTLCIWEGQAFPMTLVTASWLMLHLAGFPSLSSDERPESLTFLSKL